MFICPVLRRPYLLSDLLTSWAEHSFHPLTVLIGHDDPFLDDYLALIDNYESNWDTSLDVSVSHCIYPNTARGTCAALNYYHRANPFHGYYGFIGEDCVLTTPITALVAAAGSTSIAYPDDGFMSRKGLPTHPVIGGTLVSLIGRLAPEFCFHSFFDNFWQVIGNELESLASVPDVRYSHNHPVLRKRAPDEVNRLADAHLDADELAFNNWLQDDAARLLASAFRLQHKHAADDDDTTPIYVG